MKKIISILLASTMLFSFTAPTFAADSSFSESCGHIENPTRFNPTDLSDYQKCWIDFYKADQASGMIGDLLWMRLGDDMISVTRSEIRAGGKGVIRSAIEQWVVDNQLEVVAARITAAEDRVDELSASLETALTRAETAESRVAFLEPIAAQVPGLQGDLMAARADHAAALADVASLTADLTAMTADRDSQAMMLATANAQNTAHVATIAARDATIVQLNADIQTHSAATVVALSERDAARAQVTTLTADLATANATIGTRNATINQLNTDLANARAAEAIAAAEVLRLTGVEASLNAQLTTVTNERDAARAALVYNMVTYANAEAAYMAGAASVNSVYTMSINGTLYTVDGNGDIQTVYDAGEANVRTNDPLYNNEDGINQQHVNDVDVDWTFDAANDRIRLRLYDRINEADLFYDISEATIISMLGITINNSHAIQIGSRTFNFTGDSNLPIRAQGGNIEVDFSGSWQVIGTYVERDNSHDVTIAGQTVTVTDDTTITATLSFPNDHSDGTFSQTLQINGVDTTVHTARYRSNSRSDYSSQDAFDALVWDANDGWYVFRSGYGNITAVEAARDMFETQRDAARTALGDLESSVLGITGTGVSSDVVATRIGEIQGALGRLDFILNAVPTVQNVAPDLDMDGNPDGDDYNNDRGTTQISVDTLQTNGNAGTTWGDAATLLSAAIESSTFVGMHRGRPQAVTIDVGLGVMETYNIATLVDNLVDTVWEDGYDNGYSDGYDDGFDDGYAAGYTDGVAFGRANP